MKLGTENKRNVVILAALAVLAAYLLYANVLAPVSGASSGEASSSAPPGSRAIAPSSATSPDGAEEVRVGPPAGASRQASSRIQSDEFHPTLRSKRPEDRIDPMGIDPTLRLDLLAKVQAVDLAGGARNLFQFAPPPPKPDALKGPEPTILPKAPAPPAADKKEATKPAEAPPPPITLKYYGYRILRDNGSKTAFFLDGDDIVMAAEGDVVKKRYRVVRIGVTSVVMEDTESKRQQTLPLQPDAA
jgi:hypothetical protein